MSDDGFVPSGGDYAWFEVTDQGLSVESCLTFAMGLTAEEVVARLGGVEVGRMTGLESFDSYCYAVTAAPGGEGRDFAAVVDLPGGALMVETHSLSGATDEILQTLSRGTGVAVVYTTEVNDPRFMWAEDGTIRITFDPGLAAWREGADPDCLLDVMRRLGFNFSTAEPDDPTWVHDDQAVGRAFALAEYLTGIRFTENVLTEPTYLAAAIPSPLGPGGPLDALPPLHFDDEEEPCDREIVDLTDATVAAAEMGESLTVEQAWPGSTPAAVRYTIRTIEQTPNLLSDISPPRTVWLLVHVEATGVRHTSFGPPSGFCFVAADGTVHRPMGVGGDGIDGILPKLLEPSLLAPGQRLSGLILFAVPSAALPGGRVAYLDDDDQPLGYWVSRTTPERHRPSP